MKQLYVVIGEAVTVRYGYEEDTVERFCYTVWAGCEPEVRALVDAQQPSQFIPRQVRREVTYTISETLGTPDPPSAG